MPENVIIFVAGAVCMLIGTLIGAHIAYSASTRKAPLGKPSFLSKKKVSEEKKVNEPDKRFR